MLDHHPNRRGWVTGKGQTLSHPARRFAIACVSTYMILITGDPKMLTQKRLREVLHYDPATGIFTWTKGKRRGKVAGTTHDKRGFLKVAIDNERHQLHRLAWLWMTGLHTPWSIEHVNGDHSDNRWGNLRLGAKVQKTAHRASWPEPTAYPGVARIGDRFDALVETTRETLNLGSFETAEEARDAIILARRAARERQRQRQGRAA